MKRSVFAVVVGFVVIGLLSFGTDAIVRASMPGYFTNGRVDSVPLLIATLAYVTFYAIGGCYLAARLAPNRPMRHAMILGFLGLVFNISGTIAAWETAPRWYHIVALLLVLPSAWAGGRIRELQLGGNGAPATATAA